MSIKRWWLETENKVLTAIIALLVGAVSINTVLLEQMRREEMQALANGMVCMGIATSAGAAILTGRKRRHKGGRK